MYRILVLLFSTTSFLFAVEACQQKEVDTKPPGQATSPTTSTVTAPSTTTTAPGSTTTAPGSTTQAPPVSVTVTTPETTTQTPPISVSTTVPVVVTPTTPVTTPTTPGASTTVATPSYTYIFEFIITGDAKPLLITYDRADGKTDSVTVSTFPHRIQLKTIPSAGLTLRATKLASDGTVNVETVYKGKSVNKTSASKSHAYVLVVVKDIGTVTALEIQPDEWRCGTYNGRDLYTGPRGGCYYINSNGNKTYVDRSYCNCG